MFNPSHPHITLPSPNGPLSRNIRPSFPTKADRVVAELNALFAEQAQAFSAESKSTPTIGIWHLEPTCDAISAYFLSDSREDVAEMVHQALNAAEELKHHPSISVCEGTGERWMLLVTCGTHRPAGLSVKDPRLARRIGGIAGAFVKVGEEMDEMDEMGGTEGLVEWHWRENMRRARVSMVVGVEEGGEVEEGRRIDEQRYWRMNTIEDVEQFMKDEAKKGSPENSMPTLRGLVL
jgi:pterin-4a-carbinolamine dehydratase